MNVVNSLMRSLVRLHKNEQGAEGLEKILILAAIVIPLLGVLLIFRSSITSWVSNAWETMVGQSNINDPNPSVP